MRALLAITVRELRERWTLPLAVFCWGFAALFLVRWLDMTARQLATLSAVPAAWAVALLMGGSVIARDLADGRLAFFFARPVPWWSIAGGKLLAALVLSVAVPIAGLLPAVVADWRPAADAQALARFATGGGLLVVLALPLVLVGLGHVAIVVYRARSTWAAVDFLLVGACVWGGVWLYYDFARLGVVMGGPPPSPWALVRTLLLIAAVPLTATAVQVAVGRSDLRRGHRALSLTFWAGVLAWGIALGGMLMREMAVAPSALAFRALTGASPDGRLVGLVGMGGGRREAAFLLDTETGGFVRQGLGSRPAFSADGQRAAWIEVPPFWRRDRVSEVRVARDESGRFSVETVELVAPLPAEQVRALALAPQADRLAIVQSATLSVHEIPSGRTLSRNAAADGEWMAAAFLSDGQLRAFRRVKPSLGAAGGIAPGRIEVVAMSGGVPTGAIQLEAVGHAVLASPPDEDFVLLDEALSPRQVSLHDVRSGRRLLTLSGENGLHVTDAYLLRNGRVALLEGHGPDVRLRIAGEGEADRVLVLPAGHWMLGGEPGPDLLSLGRRFGGLPRPLEPETLFVATDTLEVRGQEVGLQPFLRQVRGPARRLAGAAAELFASASGEIVRYDAKTQRRQVLLAAPPPR